MSVGTCGDVMFSWNQGELSSVPLDIQIKSVSWFLLQVRHSFQCFPFLNFLTGVCRKKEKKVSHREIQVGKPGFRLI